MQISHYAAHVQHYARAETVEKYRKLPRGRKCREGDYADPRPPLNASILVYAAMIEDMDTGLGMVLDTLDELGIADNTVVIFTSDNGGGFRSNAPLRGGKANLWEGGLRVPTVVRGPGVKRGAQCDVPVAGWDIFPTVSDLIGNPKPLPKGLDGGSLRDVLAKGNAGKVRRPTEALVFHFPWYGNVPMSAIRLGDYKLMKNLNTGRTRLFNVVRDIGETRDLTAAMPAKSRELHRKLTDYLKAVDAEKIDDMRAARRKELVRYMDRTQKQVDDVRAKLRTSANTADIHRLKAELADKERQLQRHKAALKSLAKAEQMTKW